PTAEAPGVSRASASTPTTNRRMPGGFGANGTDTCRAAVARPPDVPVSFRQEEGGQTANLDSGPVDRLFGGAQDVSCPAPQRHRRPCRGRRRRPVRRRGRRREQRRLPALPAGLQPV